MRDGWRQVTLGETADIVKGTSPIQKTQPGPYPLIVTGAEPSSSAEFQFDAEAVCVPMVSSTGHGHASLKRVHYASGRFAVANIISACIVREHVKLSTRYLHLYLQHYKDDLIVTRMKGTANVSLSVGRLAEVPIALPPIGEQRRIVDLIAAVDTAIDTADAEARATEDALTSTLAAAVTITDRGSHCLADMFSFMLGGAWGSEPGVEEQSVTALGPTAYRGGVTSVDPSRGSARSLSLKRAEARTLLPGDIVLERSGGSPTQPVGRVIRMDDSHPWVVPSDFMRLLRVDISSTHPGFAFWVLWMSYRTGGALPFQKRTTSIFNLNITDYLAGVRFHLPVAKAQAEIATLGDSGWAAVESARATAGSLRVLRSNLLTVLLSGDHEIPQSYDRLLEEVA